ncbi:lytic transglycosylase domain-containing protein [Paenibacillus kobensis]|uniref:lytic transglycosylase domain-containing protein n=1 Tax=Paenibacillus kobensis TaxID=59841 RepID=UPI000FDAFBDA|nr:lytic transglycosylase domain-containing protein [Paenibacillus kobensis]
MSIDPRILKTMLQLQWMPSLNANTSSSSPLSALDSQGGSSLFDSLLSQYMYGEINGGDSASGLESTLGLGTLSIGDNFMPPLMNAYNSFNSVSDSVEPSEYDGYIEAAAAKYGIDPNLVKAVIRTESSYDANAVSSAGAKGLMQLMDGTARSMGVTNSFDPIQNIEGGTRYLSSLLNRYDGNEAVALAAYNAGPGRVDRLGASTNDQLYSLYAGLPSETQRYVMKVMAAKQSAAAVGDTAV